jgi:alkylation response protein AidB-like acyl-CoA dehydrogenase
MDFRLSEEQSILRDMVRDFATREIEPIAAESDAEHRFPTEILQKASALGLMGVTVPVEYGGSGMDYLSYILILEEIAKSCASTAVILSVHNTLGCGTLLKFGNEDQKTQWLSAAAKGESLGAYLLTEPGAGSDAASLTCRAEKVEGGWKVNGSKAFITNAGHASFGILYASTDSSKKSRGISAFYLDMHSDGVQVGAEEAKMGLNASSTVMVNLEDVFVPANALLNEEGNGFSMALEMLNLGRIGIAAQALGMAEAALEESLKYSMEREQFGQPIGRFESIQEKLTTMHMEVEAARLLTYRAALAADQGENLILPAATAKLFASKAAVRCAEAAVQIHGGYGYSKEYKVERIFRDARVTEIYEGTSEVQRLVMARQLLDM